MDAVVEALRGIDPGVASIEADFAEADAAARRRRRCRRGARPARHPRGQPRAQQLELLDDVTAEELDLSFAVNARGPLLLAQAFAAQHDGRPGGRP